MTDKEAAAAWAVLASASSAYPSVAWSIRSDDYAITIEARRARWCVGFGFIREEIQDHAAPDQWLSWELDRMVRELDRGERT